MLLGHMSTHSVKADSERFICHSSCKPSGADSTEEVSVLTGQQIRTPSCKSQTCEIDWSKFCSVMTLDRQVWQVFGKFEVGS